MYHVVGEKMAEGGIDHGDNQWEGVLWLRMFGVNEATPGFTKF
jgi:hypothetical protein